jgi:hypothetical protein
MGSKALLPIEVCLPSLETKNPCPFEPILDMAREIDRALSGSRRGGIVSVSDASAMVQPEMEKQRSPLV